MPDELASAIRAEISKLFAPLAAAASVPTGSSFLVQSIGHLRSLGLDPALEAELGRIGALVKRLEQLPDEDLASWEGIFKVLQLGRDVATALRAIASVLDDPTLIDRAERLGVELAEHLLAAYLRNHHSRLFRVASALTLVTAAEHADPQPMTIDGSTVTRMSWTRDRVHIDRVGPLIEDAQGVLSAEYLPGGMQTAADAHLAADRLFPVLSDVAQSLGLAWSVHLVRVTPEPPLPPPGDEEDAGGTDEEFPTEEEVDEAPPDLGPVDLSSLHHDYQPRLAVYLPRDLEGEPAQSRFGLAVTASSGEHPDGVRGFVLTPVGEVGWSEVRGGWRIGLSSDGAIPALTVGPGGVQALPPTLDALAALTVERVPPDGADPGPVFVLGAADGTRIEFGALRLTADAVVSAERKALALSADANSSTLVLVAGNEDGFLVAVLPDRGVRVPFDLGIVLSSDRGLQFRGGAGLDLTLTVRRKVGPVTVQMVRLRIEADAGAVRATVGSTFEVRLGPMTFVVQDLGLTLTVSSSPAGGSLGSLDLDAGLQWPSGVGVMIDAGVVTGGGLMRYDDAAHRYFGILALRLGTIDVAAFGLLDTRLPRGRPGFALLIMLRASFPPISVGFGFSLTAVGGLLALNRRVDVDALRHRLASGTAGRILAPENPIRNAPSLLADVDAVFPVAPGVHVVGPTLQLVWAGLVHFDVGVFIELPGPRRVVILGSARAAISRGSRTYLLIRVDIVGVIDLQASTAAFDAVLIDSQLLEVLELTGGAAFRLSWGAQPYAVLTIGGFHPAYDPQPLVFPSSLSRIAMVRGDPDDSVYLRFEGYFAITSNTLQFGANIEAVLRAGSFSVRGHIEFHALIRFQPFHFQFDIRAQVHVRYKSRNLAGLTLTGSLSGPGPVILRGKVCIELLFFDICFEETFTLGSSEPPPLTTVPSALAALLAELDEPGNVRASDVADRYVAVKMPPPGLTMPVVSPLGQLLWIQRRAPLGLLLQRIGGAPLGVPERVDATSPDSTGSELDWFAPGSFAELTDAEALNRRAFERLAAGVRLGPAGVDDGPAALPVELTVRQIRLPARAPSEVPSAAFPTWLTTATAARYGATPAEPAEPAVTVREETWTVLDPAGGVTATGVSQSQAHQFAALGPRAIAVATADRLPSIPF